MKTLRDVDPDRLYTLNDVRNLVPGWHGCQRVSLRSVYRWLADGKLQGVKVGRNWMVTGAELLKFLNVQAPAPFVYETKARQQERGRRVADALLAEWGMKRAKTNAG